MGGRLWNCYLVPKEGYDFVNHVKRSFDLLKIGLKMPDESQVGCVCLYKWNSGRNYHTIGIGYAVFQYFRIRPL